MVATGSGGTLGFVGRFVWADGFLLLVRFVFIGPAPGNLLAPPVSGSAARLLTWVTERTGDMGYTFSPGRGREVEAMEGKFCYGRTHTFRDSARRRRE